MKFIYFIIASSCGAGIRVGLGHVLSWIISPLPIATLIANLSGGLLAGICWQLFDTMPTLQTYKWIIAGGFLGALTTFSTYGVEVFTLLKQGQWGVGLGYVLISNLGILVMIGIGMTLTSKFQ